MTVPQISRLLCRDQFGKYQLETPVMNKVCVHVRFPLEIFNQGTTYGESTLAPKKSRAIDRGSVIRDDFNAC